MLPKISFSRQPCVALEENFHYCLPMDDQGDLYPFIGSYFPEIRSFNIMLVHRYFGLPVNFHYNSNGTMLSSELNIGIVDTYD